jgi:hypothetical protein
MLESDRIGHAGAETGLGRAGSPLVIPNYPPAARTALGVIRFQCDSASLNS